MASVLCAFLPPATAVSEAEVGRSSVGNLAAGRCRTSPLCLPLALPADLKSPFVRSLVPGPGSIQFAPATAAGGKRVCTTDWLGRRAQAQQFVSARRSLADFQYTLQGHKPSLEPPGGGGDRRQHPGFDPQYRIVDVRRLSSIEKSQRRSAPTWEEHRNSRASRPNTRQDAHTPGSLVLGVSPRVRVVDRAGLAAGITLSRHVVVDTTPRQGGGGGGTDGSSAPNLGRKQRPIRTAIQGSSAQPSGRTQHSSRASLHLASKLRLPSGRRAGLRPQFRTAEELGALSRRPLLRRERERERPLWGSRAGSARARPGSGTLAGFRDPKEQRPATDGTLLPGVHGVGQAAHSRAPRGFGPAALNRDKPARFLPRGPFLCRVDKPARVGR